MNQRGLIYTLLSLLLFSPVFLFSQEPGGVDRREPGALSPQELYSMSALPPLEVPARYLGRSAPALPWWVDNSTQPYFRSITTQTGFECGQSAGVSFVFTYEIDRLRGLPADTIINQYPSHFTWDFLNGGDRYGGASCFDSWEIVRTCGNMNVADYGGDLGTGGHLRWISGYDNYYRGMFNRISSMNSIRVDSPEGLNTLKYWLSDHLEGSQTGGVAILYGTYFHPDKVLQEGTPEGGKYVEEFWGPMATHTFTVVGYNDSIRYDYNGDGLYTNDIDITNDGVVDMHDWEIGALKIASGFDGPSWSNDGFIYTMYKCLADNLGYGGIWNHSVYVISVRETCEPKLTAKVILKHNSRNKIRVTMGISTDLQSNAPDHIFEYPIFRFQGGDHYMQGDTTETAKTIEFGLDLSPLINQIENGQEASYFLQVEEKDPLGSAEGEVIRFSLIDYTNGSPQTIDCPQTNIPIANNTLTLLKIDHSVTVERPVIITESLPSATPFEPYSAQMSATGGNPPYRWDALLNYYEAPYYENYPEPEGEKLTLSDNSNGYAVVDLPFAFPFYNRTVSQLYIYADGYIAFDDQPFSWPFLIDRNLLYKYSALICPFMAELDLYPTESDGIWYTADDQSVLIRWKASIHNNPGTYDANFAVKLSRSGEIIFYYGSMHFPSGLTWTGGLSAGDNLNYQLSSLNGKPYISGNTADHFAFCMFPPGMKITTDGMLTGSPPAGQPIYLVNFRVSDSDGLSSEKSLSLDMKILPLSMEIQYPPDSMLLYGDTLSFDLTVKAGGAPGGIYDGVNFRLSFDDPYCKPVDTTEQIISIYTNQTITVPGAFTLFLDPSVPDLHKISFSINAESGTRRARQPFTRRASAPGIVAGQYTLSDGDDNRLDPGETTAMTVTFKNNGSAALDGAKAYLLPAGNDLAFNSASASLGNLEPGGSAQATFSITAAKGTPFNNIYKTDNYITGKKNFETHDTVYIVSRPGASEDFETGDYRMFDWFKGGSGIFHIDTLNRFEGKYCAKSGWIVNGQFSTLHINAHILSDGEISFYMKLSCEYDPGGNHSYDHFSFYIDEIEVGRWDGEIDWTKRSYPVNKGYHQFRWEYRKDFSYGYGSDCAWLDLISFPPMNRSFPAIGAAPSSIEKTLSRGTVTVDTLLITNAGFGRLDFTSDIQDLLALPKNLRKTFDNHDSAAFRCITDGIIPGEPFTWNFSLFNNSNPAVPIHGLRIDLCDDLKITGIGNFTGGSGGELEFDSISSDSSGITWRGKDNAGCGVLLPGETATAIFEGVTNRQLTSDVFLVYTIFRDTLAGNDAMTTAHLAVPNRCLPNDWLTLEQGEGSLIRGEAGLIRLRFDTRELTDGTYRCNIIIKDGSNNNLYVPVTVQVIDTADSPLVPGRETVLLKSYPNPSNQVVTIEFISSKPGFAEAIVYDIFGKRIKTLVSEMLPAGKYNRVWDRKTDNGTPVEPGIYYCTLKSGEDQETIKLILVR